MANSLIALALLAFIAAGAAAQGVPPPAGARPPPTAVTASPPSTITRASPPPAAMRPPFTAPPALPTTDPITAKPTKPVEVPKCSPGAVGSYYDKKSFTCKKCLSTKSPFRTARGGVACYPPSTLSSRSSVCTAAVLPAVVPANRDGRRCINARNKKVVIYLPIRSSTFKFLNVGSYAKSSIRLNNGMRLAMRRRGRYDARTVRVRGIRRFALTFNDRFGSLRKSRGKTVRLTGVLRRDGALLDYCFVSYVKVCSRYY